MRLQLCFVKRDDFDSIENINIKHIICLICLGKHYIMKERVHQFLLFLNCIIISNQNIFDFFQHIYGRKLKVS